MTKFVLIVAICCCYTASGVKVVASQTVAVVSSKVVRPDDRLVLTPFTRIGDDWFVEA